MLTKRIIAVAMMGVLLLATIPFSALAKEVTVNATNIDASRGVGELVIYTPSYGDSTGTNFWGMEVVVDANHQVVEMINGNADIPKDGFVLSGHDDESTETSRRMKTWIMQNVTVGDYVYVDKRTLTVTVSDKPLNIKQTVFYEVSQTVTDFNGIRNEDTLIVYTPTTGESTGTNEYGYEVAVDNGIVISRGGNNTAIPAKGFVVSAHGMMADWLRTTVIDGMRAEYDRDSRTVRFIYDAQSVKTAVTNTLTATEKAVEEAKAAFVYADYELASSRITQAKKDYDAAEKAYAKDKNDAAYADACDTIMALLNKTANSLCDSYPVQYRGVWVRPSQKSAEEVHEYVKKLVDDGINMISVEGYFENGVIMELPEGCLFEKHPAFSYDVLQAYIDACHEFGVECHLWMPILNIGDEGNGFNRSVLSKKPEWLSLNQNGTPDNPDGFRMVDPANKEARKYLVDFYRYLITTYDIDCFELDYIRYYAQKTDLDFGYTQAAFDAFEKQYEYGVTPTYDKNANYWNDWVQFRRDCVTQMVTDVRAMINEYAPHMVLSADVAPDPDDARDKNYQDYPHWLQEGLLDAIHLMAYGDGYGPSITNAVELGGSRTMVATGLGAMTDSLGAEELERQAREDNAYGAYGDVYFEAATYLADKAYAELKNTVYREKAIPPFLNRDLSITTSLDYMQARLDNVLLPLEGVSEAQAQAITQAIAAAKESVAQARISPAALTALSETIAAVENSRAREVLQSDLLRAQRISCVTYQLDAQQLYDEANFEKSAAGMPWVTAAAIVGGLAVILIVLAVVLVKRRQTVNKDDQEEGVQ